MDFMVAVVLCTYLPVAAMNGIVKNTSWSYDF